MKILHFLHTYGETNGVSYYVQNMVSNMPRQVEHKVISAKGRSLPFFSSLKIPTVEFFEALGSDFDIIHVHAYGNFFSFFGAIVSCIRNKPLVWSIYGYPRLTGPRKLIYYAYRYLMAPLIFWRACAITSVSHDAIDILKKETGKAVEFIPSGIDLDFFKNKDSYRRQENVCFVGRLDPDKQVFRLLECKSFPLLFLGPDEDNTKKKLEAEAKKLGRNASFLEAQRSQVPSIYESCRYVVLPSKYEGFPLTMLESLAMERPFIATDAGEVKSVLSSIFGSSAGRFMLGADLEQTIQGLEKSDLTSQMTDARTRLADYSWKKISERIAKIYSKAMPDNISKS